MKWRRACGLPGRCRDAIALEEAERTFFLDTACTVRDHVVDDQAVWIETPAGLVVLCGCAHSGVMNTVQYVRETVAGRGAAGGDDVVVPVAADGQPAVRAVLGGMHLLQARKERLQATADYLDALDLELCAPCHCTGKRAMSLLGERLPETFAEIVTGRELRLAYSARRARASSLRPRTGARAEPLLCGGGALVRRGRTLDCAALACVGARLMLWAYAYITQASASTVQARDPAQHPRGGTTTWQAIMNLVSRR